MLINVQEYLHIPRAYIYTDHVVIIYTCTFMLIILL